MAPGPTTMQCRAGLPAGAERDPAHHERGQRAQPGRQDAACGRREGGRRGPRSKSKPGVVVLLTDGEETCGGAPCELGKCSRRRPLTVHVIGYQLTGFRWTGAQSFLDAKCLAEETGGLYITAENRQDLIEAFEKTLGCPMMSAIPAAAR